MLFLLTSRTKDYVGSKILKKVFKRKKRVRSLVTVKADKFTIKIIQGCHFCRGHNVGRHYFPLAFIYLYDTFKPFQLQVISKFITCLVKLHINCKSDVLKAKQSKDRHNWEKGEEKGGELCV